MFFVLASVAVAVASVEISNHSEHRPRKQALFLV